MNYATPVKYGLMAGMIMIALMLVVYIVSPGSLASTITLVFYLPLIFLMVFGGITVRKELGGFIDLKKAFLACLLISFTATFLFDSFGYVLYAVIDPDLIEIIKEQALENTRTMMEKFNAQESDIDKQIALMEEQDMSPNLKSQLMRYAGSLLVGGIFALLIALFIRRSSPDESPAA